MRAILLAINGLVLLSFATELVRSDDVKVTWTTKAWAIKPNKAAIAKGNVAFQSNKGHNGEGTANKATLQSQMNVQGRGNFNAGRLGNSQAVQAKTAKGITATGDQSKANPNSGVRTGDAGKYHGELKNSKSGNDQNWNPSLSTGQKIDTVMHGKGDSFDAAGSKGHKYNVKPAPGQSKTGGSGVITRDGEKYNYKETKTANGDAVAQMSNVGVGPNRKTYTCQGQKVGISNCVDQNGLKYGEVVEQPDGTVIVKKTIAKGVDVPIGKAKVIKNQNGKNVATINDGMFQGTSGNQKQRDCMADYGKSGGSKVKVEKPLTLQYNSQSKDGRKTFTFPDCITFGGKITLPPGVDANRIAVQFDISILPAGKLKCVDPGACNKDCYYCNLCTNSRKVDILGNSNGQQICNAKGGGTYPISVTACPPPDTMNKAVCSGFTKADPTYFKKKGDVQARVLIWERPANEQQLRDQYFNTVNSNSIAKTLLKTQFAVDNKAFINANNPTDFDLAEYYIKKNARPAEELVGCWEATTNYTVSSQKVRTDFLLEAGSLASAPKSLFDNKQCPEVDKINQAEADQQAAAAKAKAPAKSGWGSFGSFFPGGGR